LEIEALPSVSLVKRRSHQENSSATPPQGWNHEPVRAAGLGDASASQFRSPIGLVDLQQNREKVIQQKARLRTLMCGRRPGMQEQ
jgi:hypothetical protein